MALLPNKRMTLDIMVITKLLSSRGTNSLGDFEMQYLYDPVGVKAAEEWVLTPCIPSHTLLSHTKDEDEQHMNQRGSFLIDSRP